MSTANPQPHPIDLHETLSSLPPQPWKDLRAQTRTLLSTTDAVPILVALDDDPTGTQTCHAITVLTVWDTATLTQEFRATPKGGGFFILTNSRALHPPDAHALIVEICTNLRSAARETGTRFEVVLRGDSTLRGHFPTECEAVEEVLGRADAWVLAPFFLQGGRYTIGDVHYVAEGGKLVPAGETPFARDATFGYRSSDLRDWVVEKSKGAIGRERVESLGMDLIRKGGAWAVCEDLMSFEKGVVVVVNAAAEEDVDVVVLGILEAAKMGKRFLFRTGAAFVSARLGISPIPPISAETLSLLDEVGGLILAGSYVPKTTAQLETLISGRGDKVTTIVIDVEKLLASPSSADEMLTQSLLQAEQAITRGQDVLVMTSRKLVTGSDERSSLDIGSTIAKTLVSFVGRLNSRPRYIIAKGGITSSDCAGKSLRMRRARVVGQAAPGVPLWKCEEETSKWPGLPYVVFPGNVGSEKTLLEVVEAYDPKSKDS